MNSTTFDSLIQTALGTDHVTQAKRKAAMLRTIAEYSRYEPALRRYGEAQVALISALGATTITCAGGTFTTGDIVLIDPGGWSEIEATITARTSLLDDTFPANLTIYTLSAPLSRATVEGETVTFKDSTKLGIALVAGRENYPLPDDFLLPDQPSFDIAIGAKSQVRRQVTFYDFVYYASSLLSGTGIGGAAGFASGLPFGVARPIPVTEPGIYPSVRGAEWQFRFYAGAGRPRLAVSPAPTEAKRLYFDYAALHTVASIPFAKTELFLHYVRYVTLSQEAHILAQMLEYSEAGVQESPTRNASELMKQATDAKELWDKEFRNRPFCISG